MALLKKQNCCFIVTYNNNISENTEEKHIEDIV